MSQTHSDLHSFIIFNGIPPTSEGADPIIYWHYSEQTDKQDYELNYTGLLITFINFCKKWGTMDLCDYISTNDNEIGLLPLFGDIWMAVSINSKSSSKRSLLREILKYCRMMFSHFFVPIDSIFNTQFSKNDAEIIQGKRNEIENSVIDAIKNVDAFTYIVQSIDWNALDVTYLFDSYHIQPISKDVEQLESVCNELRNLHPKLFEDVLILYRKHRVVYSSFNPTVTRALSFAMRKKFKYMYLHNPVTIREFAWLLGLYVNDKGITSVYQQPIYFDGEAHPFVAFKYHRFKIVLTTPTKMELTEHVFNSMPEKLAPIRSFLKECYPEPKPSVLPFIRAVNNTELHKFVLQTDKVETPAHHAIHQAFLGAHELAINYSKEPRISLPVQYDYFVECKVDGPREALLAAKKEVNGASEYLRVTKILDKDTKKPTTDLCTIA